MPVSCHYILCNQIRTVCQALHIFALSHQLTHSCVIITATIVHLFMGYSEPVCLSFDIHRVDCSCFPLKKKLKIHYLELKTNRVMPNKSLILKKRTRNSLSCMKIALFFSKTVGFFPIKIDLSEPLQLIQFKCQVKMYGFSRLFFFSRLLLHRLTETA